MTWWFIFLVAISPKPPLLLFSDPKVQGTVNSNVSYLVPFRKVTIPVSRGSGPIVCLFGRYWDTQQGRPFLSKMALGRIG